MLIFGLWLDDGVGLCVDDGVSGRGPATKGWATTPMDGGRPYVFISQLMPKPPATIVHSNPGYVVEDLVGPDGFEPSTNGL